jgi:flagellar protein FliJ
VKRFEFSLDRLLKLKRQRERMAELEQARCRNAVDQAQKKVEEIQQRLLEITSDLNSLVGQATTPQQWVARFDISNQLGEDLQKAKVELAAAEQKYWEASQERSTLAAEVEAIQTLRQQQWDQYRNEKKQEDQTRLDELIMRRLSVDEAFEIQSDESEITS